VTLIQSNINVSLDFTSTILVAMLDRSVGIVSEIALRIHVSEVV